MLLAQLRVQAVQYETQVIQPAHIRRQVAAADARQQLLDWEARHAAVGRVGVELRHPARHGVEGVAAPNMSANTAINAKQTGLHMEGGAIAC